MHILVVIFCVLCQYAGASVIGTLFAIKLYEMVASVVWCFRKGDAFLAEIESNVEGIAGADVRTLLVKHEYPGFRSRFDRFFFGDTPRPRASWIIGLVFRYPSLMCFSCMYLVFASERPIRLAMISFLLLGMCVETVFLYAMRYKLGAIHDVIEVSCVSVVRTTAIAKGRLNQRSILQHMMALFAVTFVIILVSYAAIYFAIGARVLRDCYTLVQGQRTPLTIVQALYFSVATLCTVGFGDISVEGAFAEMVSISQMSVGFLLLVLVLAGFNASRLPAMR